MTSARFLIAWIAITLVLTVVLAFLVTSLLGGVGSLELTIVALVAAAAAWVPAAKLVGPAPARR